MIDVDRITFAQKEFRTTAPQEDSAVLTRHPMATELTFTTLMQNNSDAVAFALEILGLRKLDRWNWACYVNKINYPGLEIGMTITITYPRFGLQAGKNFIIKRLKTDSNALFDELSLFGPQ